MSIITEKLRAVMALDPAAPVIDFHDIWYDWGALAKATSEILAHLEKLSVPVGGRVGVFLHNRPAHIAAFLAILSSDRCLVTLNPLYPDATLSHDLTALNLPVVIGEAGDLDRPAIADALAEQGAGVIEIDPLLAKVSKLADYTRDTEMSVVAGVAIEMLTSGTTGKPKRVPLLSAAFDASFSAFAAYEKGRDVADRVQLRSSTTLIVNPVTHIGGIYGAIGAIMAGRRICLLERFSVDAWMSAVMRHKLKVAPAVPAALRMLLEADLPQQNFSSLSAIISGTAPLNPEVVDAFLERYGVPILGNYGATEFAGAVAGWSLQDFKAYWPTKRGAAGRVHGNVEARVVDFDTGEPLAYGTEGLLELKAAQIGDVSSWKRTTDRAVLDADGFLFIKGRADNAIVRGGFKIHPDDVVKALESHPAIREAAVVGVNDQRLGQVPAAAIILADGAAAIEDDTLRAFLKERLLPYQVPDHFRYVADFPRTGSMKPATLAIRDLFAATP